MTHTDQHPSRRSTQTQDALVRRARKRVFLGFLFLILVVILSQAGATWAQPHQNGLRSSVPTKVATATPGASATPSPTVVPGVTRIVLQKVDAEDPGYHGTTDTYIDSNIPRLPTTLEGNLRLKGAGGQSALIRFDLEGQIPAGAQVQAAELVFYVEHPVGIVPHELETSAFRVLPQWSEQEASWRYRHAGAQLPWEQEGCNGVDVDRLGVADDTITLYERAVFRGFDVTAGVQYMLDHPEENQGWLIMGVSASTGSFSLGASRNRELDKRPALRIDYVTATSETPTATPTPTTSATPESGSILVTVFDDLDRDGVYDPSERGLGRVHIEVCDYATGEVLRSGLTDPNGRRLFNDLNAPYYRVRTENLPGYLSTTDDKVRVAVGSGQALVFFGDYDPEAPTPGPADAEIAVTVCDDLNGNGECDAGEAMAGVPVVLSDAGGTPIETQTTDAEGAVVWQDLPRACYELRELLPWGYYAVSGAMQLCCVDETPALITFVNQVGAALALPLIVR